MVRRVNLPRYSASKVLNNIQAMNSSKTPFVQLNDLTEGLVEFEEELDGYTDYLNDYSKLLNGHN
ncbi:MAG: hypothetical protein MMC33_009370 [Icmadophila ericetorum]|nr:hypothetical protein [Icmadophila ericetorum]